MLDYTGPDRSWAQALYRAQKAAIKFWETTTDTADFYVYQTGSSKKPSTPIYAVSVKADADGIHVSCDCLGGSNGRICLHAAKVLNVMGHLPDLPEGYDGGALRSSWAQPAGAGIDGKTALAMLNGMDS